MSNELAVTNPKQLQEYLGKSRQALVNALPRHLNADRMIRLAQTAYSTNPELRKCTPVSILSSLVVAAQLGLEPGVTGQCYLIPYKGTCTLVPGWQGLVGLLNNTGRATAWTGAVYDGDVWDFELGSHPRCRHIPGPNFGDPEALTWVYACGKVNGSEQSVIEAWPVSRVEKHRDKFNKVGSRHYSYNNFEMYARKVVLLQVLKYMPRSIELTNAITAADASEMGRTTEVQDGVVIESMEPVRINEGVAEERPVKPEKALERAVVQDPSGLNLPKMIRGLLKQDGLSEETFLSWARVEAGVESKTLETLVTDAAGFVTLCSSNWEKTVAEMRKN